MAPTNRRQVIREASEAQAAPDQHRLEGKLIGPKAGLQQPTVYRIKVARDTRQLCMHQLARIILFAQPSRAKDVSDLSAIPATALRPITSCRRLSGLAVNIARQGPNLELQPLPRVCIFTSQGANVQPFAYAHQPWILIL